MVKLQRRFPQNGPVTIGDYWITNSGDGMIEITLQRGPSSGEGGDYKEEMVAEALRRFVAEHF
jgi:hypothetical protein